MALLRTEKKDKDDDADYNPFALIDKSTVLQEARMFHETRLHPRKCIVLLTKILYLLNRGEALGTVEATETFFAVTKLFQSKDVALRRMVYLVIKEMSKIANDVIIVTSSLQKDMNSKTDATYRPNAIRALCTITDSTLIAGIERFLKQAIVDKTPAVASAALVSAIHLHNDNRDVVKRWVNEVQEAIQSKNVMVQYHALGLMYQIRQKDRMAVTKLVQSLIKNPSGVRSTFATTMLIRYAVKVMEEEDADSGDKSLVHFLESCIRNKSEIVMFEAARAICNMRNVTSKELVPAISVLQLFLSSQKAILRFAAIRTLNKLALSHPLAVSPCNLDMENLISDTNRSISTLAITTLLKTGNEASVDRLMKQIEGLMSEISDEFKVVVIEAIRVLCLKFPAKKNNMLNFLAASLREDGGFEYKKAIVDTLIAFTREFPTTADFVLFHLCEFIEDCEFSSLSVSILHLLGLEGVVSNSPSKYIRHIYNRVILENEIVRAAAVAALAQFGLHIEDLRTSVMVLLKRCLNDGNDEVRDRATLYLSLLQTDPDVSKKFLHRDPYSIPALERSLTMYESNAANFAKPFDISTVPLVNKAHEEAEERQKMKEMVEEELPSMAAKSLPDENARDVIAEELAGIPQLAGLGAVLKSSKVVQLTESETEYMVSYLLHTYKHHLVFQFKCKNTLADQLLENVIVSMTTDVGGVKKEAEIPISRLVYDVQQSCFVIFSFEEGSYPSGLFETVLKFVVRDCDPNTLEPDEEGYDDEYMINDVEIGLEDYMVPTYLTDFKDSWEQLGDECEVMETFELSAMSSLAAAVATVVEYLGMNVWEHTDIVPADKNSHVLMLSGSLMGEQPVMVRCRTVFNSATGVTMEMTVRSTDQAVSSMIANVIS